MKYRMYVDETGTHDLDRLEDDNERFLSLTGVIIDLEHVREVIYRQLQDLKDDILDQHPDEPIVLHRNKLVRALGPFKILRNADARADFDERLIGLLQRWDYTVVTVCLDKKNHKETYTRWLYHPYHYCLEMLIERYVFYLEQVSASGDVMAESRGGTADMKLKDSFRRLWKEGTRFVAAERLQSALTSKELKVKPKTYNIPGLQIADIIARPSRNEILSERGLLAKPLSPFDRLVIESVQAKYYQKEGRGVAGFGKKFQ